MKNQNDTLNQLSYFFSSRKRLSSVGLLLSVLGAVAATSACGGDDEPGGGDGDGDGDGDASTGGSLGDGDGDTGGTTGDGDGDTGGGAGDGDGDGDGDGAGGNGSGGNGNVTAYNCDPAEGAIPTLALEVVEDGFSEPVLVTHAGDERLFVVERVGRIHVIENGSKLETPFLDIVNEVDSSGPYGEMGMLGLAFHPNHAENGLLYVYYIHEGGTWGSSRVVEYSVMAEDPNQVDTSTEREVISVPQPDQNHNGGTIEFGPDGMLYLGLGDGGGSGDPDNHGQTATTLLGSLLRIDVDGRTAGAYSVPSGNLSEVLESAAPEIFSYGLRNPYRFNFDACTGDLYIGDVGQNAWEEVTITPSGLGQLNYGWKTMEGLHCYSPANGCNMSGLTMPQIEYARGGGSAVIGGTVYRGSEIPSLRGKYFYSDTIQSHLWYVQYNSGTNMVDTPTNIGSEVGGAGGIVAIQNGHDGEIYMANRVTGAILKLVAVAIN